MEVVQIISEIYLVLFDVEIKEVPILQHLYCKYMTQLLLFIAAPSDGS
jgi:hypothetical protein